MWGGSSAEEAESASDGVNMAQPTKAEALAMSKYAYGGASAKGLDFGTWKPVSNQEFGLLMSDESSGYQAALFERKISGVTQYTLAFAGTEEIKRDGLNDVLQVLGASEQYAEAVGDAHTLSDAVGRTYAIYVGHSLGGGLAIAASMATGSNAVTFNPAWVSDATIDHLVLNHPGHIDNYIIRGEILDYAQKKYGSDFGLHSHGDNHYESSWRTLVPGAAGRVLAHFKESF